jgi:hypothetical protein
MRYRIKVEYQVDDKILNLIYTAPGESVESAIEIIRQIVINRMASRGGSILSISEDI